MELFKCKMIISIFVFPHFSYAWRTVSTSSTMLQNLETAAKIYLKSSRASNEISERFPRGIFQIEMLSVEIFHGEETRYREIRFHSQPWLSRVELFRKHGKKIWLQVVRWIAFEALAWSLKIHEISKAECEKSLRNWFLNWRFLLFPSNPSNLVRLHKYCKAEILTIRILEKLNIKSFFVHFIYFIHGEKFIHVL